MNKAPVAGPTLGEELGVKLAPGGLEALDRARKLNKRTKVFDRTKRPTLHTWNAPVRQLPNWIIFANAGAPAGIKQVSAELIVPAPPSIQREQILYVFIGLQDTPVTMIVQPVLQWNLGPEGVNRWSISSWFVECNSDPVYTTPVPVVPGERLKAIVAFDREDHGHFNYWCGFDGYKQTQIKFPGLTLLSQSVCVLEGYGVQHCLEYPASSPIAWTNLQLLGGDGPLNLDWSTHDRIINCGQHCVVTNQPNGVRVDLHCE